MNWSWLWSFHVAPLELIARGTLMYWFLFLMFRFVLRRDVGAVGVADVLLVVLIADASQNAMAGSYDSVSEGAVLVATLGGWNYFIDWAGYRFPALQRFFEAPPLPLIRNGRVLHRNLRAQYLTLDELRAHLRQSGIDAIGDVKAAYMEGDGNFSVIKRSGDDSPPPTQGGTGGVP